MPRRPGPRKTRKSALFHRGRPTPSAVMNALSPLQKVAVKKLVKAPAETKYVANIAQVYGGGSPAVQARAFGVLNSIVSGGTSFSAWQLLPLLAEGPSGSERVGNKISDASIRSDWQFYINPGIANYPTVDATVKVFILRSKTAKSFGALQSVPPGSLLDNGDATSIDWTSTNAIDDKALAMYPVNKEQFTVLKIHQFRLAKNADSPTGAGTGAATTPSPNMTSHQTKDFSHAFKHTGQIVYPDGNLTGSLLPTNLTYFAYVVAWDTNSFAVLPANTVLCNVRTHMWFKDM